MNDDEGGSSRDAENKLPWYQKIRGRIKPIFTNPMFFTFIILFIIVAFVIYWYYVRPKWYKKIFRILLLFEGFKYSHLTSQEIEASENQQLAPPIGNTTSHFLIFGSSGSGKTSFLKHYLTQKKIKFCNIRTRQY